MDGNHAAYNHTNTENRDSTIRNGIKVLPKSLFSAVHPWTNRKNFKPQNLQQKQNNNNKGKTHPLTKANN